MDSNLTELNLSKEKSFHSVNPVIKTNSKTKKKILKNKRLLYINNNSSFGNPIDSRRRKFSSASVESNSYYQPLTVSREENNYDQSEILHKKYLISITKIEQINTDISNINKKLDDNNMRIEKLTENLKKLKEEKKQKQIDIVNLLSNKESLEEIYKNKVYFLIKSKGQNEVRKNKNISDITNTANNECKAHIESNSEIFNIEEEKELEINIDEIKKSDKKKFLEQVINLAEDIFQKHEKDEILHSRIKDKLKIAYNVFFF